MEWEGENDEMEGFEMETDLRQVDDDGDSAIGDLGTVKYVFVCCLGSIGGRGPVRLENLADTAEKVLHYFAEIKHVRDG